MPVEKFSVSTSRELFDALETLRSRREEDRSSLIEMLLREHPMVRDQIQRERRKGRGPRTKRGRERTDIETLARIARRRWQEREAAGEVAFVDR